ncbi:MAG: hypothetical protein D6730_24635, partial [Bacteroidetes bacterium]
MGAMLLLLAFSKVAEAKDFTDPTLLEYIKPITGKVVDNEGKPLVGVTIRVKGTSAGTITDEKGAFTIEAETGDVLVFSYYGFSEQEVVIGSQNTLNIRMLPDVNTLDEVVVIGYGTRKKSHLTGAISKVENEQLDQ